MKIIEIDIFTGHSLKFSRCQFRAKYQKCALKKIKTSIFVLFELAFFQCDLSFLALLLNVPFLCSTSP